MIYKKIDLDRALAIAGWMEPNELEWLAVQAQKHNFIVEIGSYLGRSTMSLVAHTEGTVVALDDWKGPREAPLTDEDRKTLFSRFQDNLRDYIDSEKLKVVQMDYAELPKLELTPPPDMVFIDGNHQYEDVKRDILWARAQMKDGGLISGHDLFYSDVRKAVYEAFPDVQTAPGSIWWTELLRNTSKGALSKAKTHGG
jgi:predicted O-methyltransferase YrrM